MLKLRKIVVFFGCMMAIFMVLSGQTTAEAKDTKAKALKAYKKVLAEHPYKDIEGGFEAESFIVKDLNKDGIPELIIDDVAPQIFTYKDGEVKFLYHSFVLCSLTYSASTKNFMIEYSWNGRETYTVYKLTKKGELSLVADYELNEKKYYDYSGEKPKKITKATMEKNLKKYMPKKVKVETKYKNTKANRDKYLK